MTSEITVSSITPELYDLNPPPKKGKKNQKQESDIFKVLQDKVDEEDDRKKKETLIDLKQSCQELYLKYPGIKPSKEIRSENNEVWWTELTRLQQYDLKERGLNNIRQLVTDGIGMMIWTSSAFKIKMSPHLKDDFFPTLIENIAMFDDEFREILKQFPIIGKGMPWQFSLLSKIFVIYKLSMVKKERKDVNLEKSKNDYKDM